MVEQNFPRVRDAAAAGALFQDMLGWTSVGSAGDESIDRATSPEIRAHLIAAIGEPIVSIPAYMLVKNVPSSTTYHHSKLCLASYLRSLADILDPTQITQVSVDTPTNSVPTSTILPLTPE